MASIRITIKRNGDRYIARAAGRSVSTSSTMGQRSAANYLANKIWGKPENPDYAHIATFCRVVENETGPAWEEWIIHSCPFPKEEPHE